MNVRQFPVTKSFLSTDMLSRVVEAEYGLCEVRCQLITATLRDVYLVTSREKRHVLYVYRRDQRSTDEIMAEWQFVAYLAQNGVPVAPAHLKMDGELILTFLAPEGLRHGVLTEFVAGKHLRQRPSAAAVRAYGCIIAQIHMLADAMPRAPKRPTIDLELLVDQWIAAFAVEVPGQPTDLVFLQESAAFVLPRLRQLSKEKPYYGLVHGDVIRANAQVADDGLVTVLDFDLCGFCWRAYDVASYLEVIRGLPREREWEQAFLDGYQEVRALAEVEKETLALFEAIRGIFSIGIPAMNVDHWGSAYLHAYLDRSLNQLRIRMKDLLGGAGAA